VERQPAGSEEAVARAQHKDKAKVFKWTKYTDDFFHWQIRHHSGDAKGVELVSFAIHRE